MYVDVNEIQRVNTLAGVTPTRGIDDDTTDDAGDDTGDGESDDPAHVDPGNHSPVDRAPSTRAETNTNRGTSDALSGRDGEL